jgi:large subunit ribosomal protein L17
MYRNMVTSLLEHERIRTTDAKAKEVRRLAEKMITLGKRGGLHARRRALRIIRRREVAAKVFDELAERYRDRPGGYTRVVKLGNRRGDAAALSIVELVDRDGAGKRKPAAAAASKKKATTKKAAAAKPAAKKKAAAKKAEEPSKKSAPRKKTVKKAASKKKTAGKTTAKKAAKKTASKKTKSKTKKK